MICDLWGDAKSCMPVRIETSTLSDPNMKPIILRDFVFNADLDGSLFSLEPPASYKVQKQNGCFASAGKRPHRGVSSLRPVAWGRASRPTRSTAFSAITRLFQKDWAKSHPMKGGSPTEKEKQEQLNGMQTFFRGLSFVFEELPREADAHYAAKESRLAQPTRRSSGIDRGTPRSTGSSMPISRSARRIRRPAYPTPSPWESVWAKEIAPRPRLPYYCARNH